MSGRKCTSKHLGLFFRGDSNKWRAQIQINGEKINIGCFETEEEAKEAREDFINSHK